MHSTDINIRSLKFAILQCLASCRGHQHKFNLIGKGYSPGRIESALGLQLDAAQRHLAVIAFNELEQAGLIRPTYTDLIDPEAWVEITDADRHALDQRHLDALDAALDAVAPNLVEIRAGAWAAVVSDRPDALRQAVHSARELIEQTLKTGAPDDAITALPWYSPDGTSKTGITRQHRLRYLMETRRGAASDSELRVAEQVCKFVLETNDRLKAIAHSRDAVAVSDVRDALLATEIAFRRVLLPEGAA